MLYQRLRSSSLETAAIGLTLEFQPPTTLPAAAEALAFCQDTGTYFCRFPEGPAIFACDARGGGCHCVAGDFASFLGLVCACSGPQYISQAVKTGKAHFWALINNQPLGLKQRSILRALSNGFASAAISQPYETILAAHCGQLSQPEPLHFKDGFHGTGAGKPCRQIASALPCPSGQICGVYACKNGIMVDMALETALTRPIPEGPLSAAEELLLSSQEAQPVIALELAGKALLPQKTDSLTWDPSQWNSVTAQRQLDRYGLDRATSWTLLRLSFQLPGKRPVLRNLALELKYPSKPNPVLTFATPGANDALTFTHRGTLHTLQLHSCTQEGFDYNFLDDTPNYYRQLSWSVTPEIPRERIVICDTVPSDQPRLVAAWEPPALPTEAGDTRVSRSALHYAPVEQVTWQVFLWEKENEDARIPINENNCG